MSEFHVQDIFPVSFRPTPYVVGRLVGDLAVGQRVELRKKNGTTYRGVVEAMDFHRREPDMFSFMFSSEISSEVELGDVIYSLDDSPVPRE